MFNIDIGRINFFSLIFVIKFIRRDFVTMRGFKVVTVFFEFHLIDLFPSHVVLELVVLLDTCGIFLRIYVLAKYHIFFLFVLFESTRATANLKQAVILEQAHFLWNPSKAIIDLLQNLIILFGFFPQKILDFVFEISIFCERGWGSLGIVSNRLVIVIFNLF